MELRDISIQDDRLHPKFISLRMALKRVAQNRLKNGLITSPQHQRLKEKVRSATPRDFAPLVFLIVQEKIGTRAVEVPAAKRANPNSREWVIPDLRRDEFEIMR